jgi:hypothetical protein
MTSENVLENVSSSWEMDAKTASEMGEEDGLTRVNPMQVLREAREQVSRGEYVQALNKYRWFHDEALQHDPDVYGVRRSFALRYWKQLGEVYPPARTELESVRDRKVETIRTGSSDRELFDDVSSINEMLGQVELTSDLFAEIAEKDIEFARRCFPAARPALVHTRNYSLARRFMGSPQEIVERLADRLDRSITESSSEGSALLQNADVENYIEDVQHLLLILDGVGESAEAQRLRSLASQSLRSPDMRTKVREQLGNTPPTASGAG